MTIRTKTDQFGQITYLCPQCGLVFLVTLPVQPSPTESDVQAALAFHSDHAHPGTA